MTVSIFCSPSINKLLTSGTGSLATEDSFCIFSSTESGCYLSQWLWAAPSCKQGADGEVKCNFSQSGVNFVQKLNKFSKKRTCFVDW